MKRAIIACVALATAVSVFGQGAVVFNNKTGTAAGTTGSPGSVWAPVYLPEVATPTEQKFGNTATGIPAGTQTYTGGYVIGTGYTAQLWGGTTAQSEGELSLLATTSFRTQTATTFAGTITTLAGSAGSPTIAGVANGAQAHLQLRVWDNNGGTITSWAAATGGTRAFGASRMYTTTWGLAVPPATPPSMQGLESFSLMIVPEPSAIALGVLGVGALVLFRRRKS